MKAKLRLIADLFLANLNSQTPIELFVAALVVLLMGAALPWLFRMLAIAIFPAMLIWSAFLLMFGLFKLFRGLMHV
jgi:glucan phosphoethanolaminetransferase (alkaline phosphatase superfamily)